MMFELRDETRPLNVVETRSLQHRVVASWINRLTRSGTLLRVTPNRIALEITDELELEENTSGHYVLRKLGTAGEVFPDSVGFPRSGREAPICSRFAFSSENGLRTVTAIVTAFKALFSIKDRVLPPSKNVFSLISLGLPGSRRDRPAWEHTLARQRLQTRRELRRFLIGRKQ